MIIWLKIKKTVKVHSIVKSVKVLLVLRKYPILIGHDLIKVLSMKQVYLQIFSLNLLNYAFLVKQL